MIFWSGPIDGQTDGWAKPFIELRVHNGKEKETQSKENRSFKRHIDIGSRCPIDVIYYF